VQKPEPKFYLQLAKRLLIGHIFKQVSRHATFQPSAKTSKQKKQIDS